MIRELNFCVLYRKQLMPTSNEARAVGFHNVWQLIHCPPQQNSFSARLGRRYHPSLEKVAFHSTSNRGWYLGHWDKQNFFTVHSPHGSHGSPPTHTTIAVQLLFWGGRSRKGSPGQPQGSSPPTCSIGEAALPQLWQRQSHTPASSFHCLWDVVNLSGCQKEPELARNLSSYQKERGLKDSCLILLLPRNFI